MNVATKGGGRSTFSSAAYLRRLFDDMDQAKISIRIRQARDAAGIKSRDELADLMQVHRNTIENWENPKKNVPYDRMDELADVLNVDKRWLLHGEDQPLSGADNDRIAEILRLQRELEGKVERLSGLVAEALRLEAERRHLLEGRDPPDESSPPHSLP